MTYVTWMGAVRCGAQGRTGVTLVTKAALGGPSAVTLGPLETAPSERIASFALRGTLLSRMAFQLTLGGHE